MKDFIHEQWEFKNELDLQFPNIDSKIILLTNYLPHALFIKYQSNDKYTQFCHGGISKYMMMILF